MRKEDAVRIINEALRPVLFLRARPPIQITALNEALMIARNETASNDYRDALTWAAKEAKKR